MFCSTPFPSALFRSALIRDALLRHTLLLSSHSQSDVVTSGERAEVNIFRKQDQVKDQNSLKLLLNELDLNFSEKREMVNRILILISPVKNPVVYLLLYL